MESQPRRITERSELDSALAGDRFLLFKHSPTCPISARAFRELGEFVALHGDVQVAWIHVVAERPLSQAVERATGVQHESPQALLLEKGRVVWHASHGTISAASLADACASP